MLDPSTTTCFLFIARNSQAKFHAEVGDRSLRACRTYARDVHDDPTSEVTDLLQQLIRNACVNDGTPSSGHETRSVDVLAQYLGNTGLEFETYEAQPGRSNLVTRIEGSDPNAPTLLLMGHTDVVPVNEAHWHRDPFGGELVDDEHGRAQVWGRGAVDTLNLTASMAVATKRLA